MGLLTFALNVTLDGCCDHREMVANDEMLGSTSAFAALDSEKTLLDGCNDPNDTSKQSYCLGYVAGVSDVLVGMHIICIGEHVSEVKRRA